MNTCKVYWDDDAHKVAVAYIDEGNCNVDTVHYSDGSDFSLDIQNWVANNIACWPNWQKAFQV